MTTTVTRSQSGLEHKVKFSVPAGETFVFNLSWSPCVVTGSPGTSGSVLVEATWSSHEDVSTGNALWYSWDAGTVASKNSQILEVATAVRFTATTATGTFEVSQ